MAIGAGVAYDTTRKIGEEGQGLAAEGEADYDLAIQNLTQIADDVGLSSQDYKLRDTYFQVAEELSNAGVADADELAQSIVAGIGDSRTEMSALGKVKDLLKGKRDARLEGAMLKLQGETGLTERAAKLADTQTGMYYDIADTRQRDLARINTGMDAYFGSKTAMAEGAMAMGTALSSAAISASGTPDQRAKARQLRRGTGTGTEEYAPKYDPVAFAQFGTGSSTRGAETLAPGYDLTDVYGDFIETDNSIGGGGLNIAGMRQEINPYTGYPAEFDNYFNEHGGYIGKGGGVTPGEFNHDTNKIALVDEESGQKIGEGTGGEAFHNPQQVEAIEGFLEKQDADGLLKYMTALYSLPQFQKA